MVFLRLFFEENLERSYSNHLHIVVMANYSIIINFTIIVVAISGSLITREAVDINSVTNIKEVLVDIITITSIMVVIVVIIEGVVNISFTNITTEAGLMNNLN